MLAFRNKPDVYHWLLRTVVDAEAFRAAWMETLTDPRDFSTVVELDGEVIGTASLEVSDAMGQGVGEPMTTCGGGDRLHPRPRPRRQRLRHRDRGQAAPHLLRGPRRTPGDSWLLRRQPRLAPGAREGGHAAGAVRRARLLARRARLAGRLHLRDPGRRVAQARRLTRQTTCVPGRPLSSISPAPPAPPRRRRRARRAPRRCQHLAAGGEVGDPGGEGDVAPK